MSWSEKIMKIDKRYIWILLLIAYAIPVINPLKIPLEITEPTIIAYDAIEALPEGSVVVMDNAFLLRYFPEMGPGVLAMTAHVLENDLKIVSWALGVEGAPFQEQAYKMINAEGMGKVYGVDYVNLGYIAGGETAMASLMEDIHGTVSSDYYGTPLSELPIMDEVRSAEDIDMLIAGMATQPDDRVRQYSVTGGLLWISLTTGGWVPGIRPFIEAGQILTTVGGLTGGAEYELLINRPGRGIISTDITSTTFIVITFFVILSNIAYISERSRGGQ